MLYLAPCRPNQLGHSDIAGAFKTTARNKNFKVLIYHFTKWLQVYPLPDISAETVTIKIVNE
jgi:hypothetical protein